MLFLQSSKQNEESYNKIWQVFCVQPGTENKESQEQQVQSEQINEEVQEEKDYNPESLSTRENEDSGVITNQSVLIESKYWRMERIL